MELYDISEVTENYNETINFELQQSRIWYKLNYIIIWIITSVDIWLLWLFYVLLC